MKDYQEVRAAGEALLLKTGIKCSFIRPWYVLGAWPLVAVVVETRLLGRPIDTSLQGE